MNNPHNFYFLVATAVYYLNPGERLWNDRVKAVMPFPKPKADELYTRGKFEQPEVVPLASALDQFEPSLAREYTIFTLVLLQALASTCLFLMWPFKTDYYASPTIVVVFSLAAMILLSADVSMDAPWRKRYVTDLHPELLIKLERAAWMSFLAVLPIECSLSQFVDTSSTIRGLEPVLYFVAFSLATTLAIRAVIAIAFEFGQLAYRTNRMRELISELTGMSQVFCTIPTAVPYLLATLGVALVSGLCRFPESSIAVAIVAGGVAAIGILPCWAMLQAHLLRSSASDSTAKEVLSKPLNGDVNTVAWRKAWLNGHRQFVSGVIESCPRIAVVLLMPVAYSVLLGSLVLFTPYARAQDTFGVVVINMPRLGAYVILAWGLGATLGYWASKLGKSGPLVNLAPEHAQEIRMIGFQAALSTCLSEDIASDKGDAGAKAKSH